MKRIKRIYATSFGWVNADEENPITIFTVNGEMAPVHWYKWKELEFNGKYVEIVEYYE